MNTSDKAPTIPPGNPARSKWSSDETLSLGTVSDDQALAPGNGKLTVETSVIVTPARQFSGADSQS